MTKHTYIRDADRMVRCNFYVPQDVLACLREQAVYKQSTLSAEIRKALDNHCKKGTKQ